MTRTHRRTGDAGKRFGTTTEADGRGISRNQRDAPGGTAGRARAGRGGDTKPRERHSIWRRRLYLLPPAGEAVSGAATMGGSRGRRREGDRRASRKDIRPRGYHRPISRITQLQTRRGCQPRSVKVIAETRP